MSNSRTKLIAGNWKMNGLGADAKRWAEAAVRAAAGAPNEVALIPPFPYLTLVGGIVGAPGGEVGLGAQVASEEPFGAFTGQVSAGMLKDVGCRYVLAGHSERRHGLGETDENVVAQMKQALEADLVPIVCVGETLDERNGMQARNVVLRQVEAAIDGLPRPDAPWVIAYEPVWAIGTGLTASPEQVAEVHGWIRYQLRERLPDQAEGLRILYGGSVKPGNISGLLAVEDVDGALVGGASLDPDAFAALIAATPASA